MLLEEHHLWRADRLERDMSDVTAEGVFLRKTTVLVYIMPF